VGSWRQLAALPAPRYQAAACWHDGRVYLLGGGAAYSGGNIIPLNTVFVYDPVGNTWTTAAPMPAVGLLYAFSASDGLHAVFPDTGAHYVYDPTTNAWATSATAPLVARRSAHHFVDSAGRFYLAGGQQDSGLTPITAVHRYDPSTGVWNSRAAMPIAVAQALPSRSPGVLAADSKVYLSVGTSTDQLAVYDPSSDTWAATPSIPDKVNHARNVELSVLPSGMVITLPHSNFGGPSGSPEFMARVDGYFPATGSWSMGVTPDYPGAPIVGAAVATQPGGVVYLVGGNDQDSDAITAQVWSYKQNEPPLVATLLTMTGGAIVSTASTNRARHQFNDLNAGDSQSKADHRWRKVGDPTWITETVISPNPWRDFPAGTLTAGDWERQVLTYDAAGEPSPAWTPSGLFTAVDPPEGPTITYPINGQTLDQVEHVTWSVPAQESYQVRRVADDSGTPDTDTVYFDTGEVVDSLTRTLPLDFAVNGRAEHIQVRVKDGGVWSDWDSVSGDVSYTPPPVPTFTPYPDATDASLLIMITNPDPDPGEPAAAYNDIYITEPLPSGTVVEERRVTQLPANTPWRYRVPVGGWDYSGARIRIVAVAANGTTSSS